MCPQLAFTSFQPLRRNPLRFLGDSGPCPREAGGLVRGRGDRGKQQGPHPSCTSAARAMPALPWSHHGLGEGC